jgi:heme/copper-type cytochrome/quinol oxidase subunit 2
VRLVLSVVKGMMPLWLVCMPLVLVAVVVVPVLVLVAVAVVGGLKSQQCAARNLSQRHDAPVTGVHVVAVVVVPVLVLATVAVGLPGVRVE